MNGSIRTTLRVALVATAAALAAMACDDGSGDGSGGTCTYEGESYEVGESFPAGDGCNTCSCEPSGNVACTASACIEPDADASDASGPSDVAPPDGADGGSGDAPPSDGSDGAAGDAPPSDGSDGGAGDVPTSDASDASSGDAAAGGETDGAGSADVADTANEPDATDATDGGADDGSGGVDGADAAGDADAGASGDAEAGCTHLGFTYEVGESFPAQDGCNTCTCMAGGAVSCTEKGCPCDPEAQPWRDYLYTDLEECAVALFECEEGTAFQDQCGCGCEQSVACPEEVPPEEADRCPFSTVVPPEDGCTAEQPCDGDVTVQCWAPGELAPCGPCKQPPPDGGCEGDGDCDAEQICVMSEPQDCYCSPTMVCKPACQGPDDCDTGEVCQDDGHCAPAPCGADEECPPNFDCTGDAGTCSRRSCETSEPCEPFCVKGHCYAEAGICSPPPR